MDEDRVEGKEKELEGEAQQAWGKAKDEGRDVWEDAKDKLDDLMKDREEDEEPASRPS
jgi:uncharacterized protein YjbJ (UPF0337 family)